MAVAIAAPGSKCSRCGEPAAVVVLGPEWYRLCRRCAGDEGVEVPGE